MKRVINLAVAGCAVLLLCQCATRDEVRELNYRIRAVNQKVDDVRSSTVDQMQKKQASSVSRIDVMQEEITQLQAKLEENAHQEILFREQAKESAVGMQAMLESMKAENDSRIKMLEDRIGQLERNLNKMSDARIREAEERARAAARRAEEARRRTVVAAEASGGIVKVVPENRKVKLDDSKRVEAAVTVPDQPVTVEQPSIAAPVEKEVGGDLFNQAMSLYKDNKYTEAYKLFEQVLSQNPRGDEAAETLFFMGESLFARGEYDLAILDYQKVISNHGQHRRTPTALLKQGMSFEKLTDLETAKIIYKKLIAEYPDSAEADSAQQQLTTLQ
ncbi:MAG: tol-pal system protein YbgF [Desulfobulbaceae bacterium]|nr:tol-pal system protein YbgF [Desulfobulbaceae bacterium]